jgi:molecular chaperone DnaK (HSP70)
VTTRLGIDFGTANTVVAWWNEATDQGEPIPLEGVDVLQEAGRGVTQRVVPSLVAYEHGGSRRWLGAQVTGHPELRSRSDVTVFEHTKSNVTGNIVDIPRAVGGRKVTGREAATRFVGDLMALAVLAVGDDDVEVVATAPVETFDTYRDWLVREVSEGLGPVRLRVVDEATAAAVGYSARLSPGDVFGVFDFGAGTLDVSVVRVQDGETAGGGSGVRTVAKVGLDLGGRHIDALLAEHTAGPAGLPRDDVAYNRVFRHWLAAAEQAKITLAAADRALLRAVDPATGAGYRTEVTRRDFEQLLDDRDVRGRIFRAVRTVCEKAAAKGYRAERIAKVFLVGGSSLLPTVQDVLRLQFGPDVLELDRPLEAVAAGAAGIAGGRELHDHIQHDYAIRHIDPRTGAFAFETLVEAGAPYPTDEPVTTLTVKAVHEGQQRLGLAIYEQTHATSGDARPEREIVFDEAGGARTVQVTPQQRQERTMVWLNQDHPTFLEAPDPPCRAGEDRFRLDFRVDHQKRLTVSAFDLERRLWVLDRQPVVRLA